MAKSVHDDVLDGALAVLRLQATQISVCGPTQPTTYEHATTGTGTGYRLAIESALDSTDFVIADGDGGGRKVTIAEQATLPVSITASADFVCLCDVDDRLLFVTTCTEQVLTSGNTVTIPEWKITIGDPT
jgi:hypothetical protein